MNIRRKIYIDTITGNVLVHLREQLNVVGVRETTLEEDILTFTELSERNNEYFDVIQFEIGQYAEEFKTCIGFRVNPETKTLEFSYLDPNAPDEPPVFQKPFSEQLLEIKTKQVLTDKAVEETSTTQQQLLELLVDLEVIS